MADTTGVYCITNNINGRVYVGSSSVSLARRISQHRQSLRSNTHYNEHLQRSYNKYGKDAFSFSILQKCPPCDCLNLEQRWIDRLSATDPIHGYNMRPAAESNTCVASMRLRRAHERSIDQSKRVKIVTWTGFLGRAKGGRKTATSSFLQRSW